MTGNTSVFIDMDTDIAVWETGDGNEKYVLMTQLNVEFNFGWIYGRRNVSFIKVICLNFPVCNLQKLISTARQLKPDHAKVWLITRLTTLREGERHRNTERERRPGNNGSSVAVTLSDDLWVTDPESADSLYQLIRSLHPPSITELPATVISRFHTWTSASEQSGQDLFHSCRF